MCVCVCVNVCVCLTNSVCVWGGVQKCVTRVSGLSNLVKHMHYRYHGRHLQRDKHQYVMGVNGCSSCSCS